MPRVLILIAGAFVMVSAAFGWMLRTYLPGATVIDIFLGMTPTLTVLMILILALTGVGAVGGLKHDVVRVRTTAIGTVGLGGLGAVYSEFNTHFGMLIDNLVTFETLAPGRLESLGILALGLFGALLGLGILQLGGAVRRG